MHAKRERMLAINWWDREQHKTTGKELLAVGKKLAASCEGIVCAVILGSELGDLPAEIACYVEELYVIDDQLLAGFQADLYAAAVTALCSEIQPSVILIRHDYEGMELAPKLAYRLDAELVTECLSAEMDHAGHLLCSKTVYGGNALAVFQMEGNRRILTLNAQDHETAKPGGMGKVIPVPCRLQQTDALTQLISVIPENSANLDTAEVIVAGGRGAGTDEGINLLEELAKALKHHFASVELGASRPLVDAGLFPRSRQIGQTGERVVPELYFAVAISGSSQHLSGMIGSKKIVAINKNREAPIFDVADYGIVGVFEDILPSLTAQLGELL